MTKSLPLLVVLLILSAVFILAIIPPVNPVSASAATGECPQPAWDSASFSLDGADLLVCTSFLREPHFAVPEPDSAMQVATATRRAGGFRELSITAVPFGTRPPSEALPVAAAGAAEAYREALHRLREDQGGGPHSGPAIEIFGSRVTGTSSVVDLHVDGPSSRPVIITEWVAEAGERMWIVRASRALAPGEDAGEGRMGLVLMTPDPHRPSTSLASRGRPPARPTEATVGAVSGLSSGDLQFPSWWDGDCDANNYYAATSTDESEGIYSYPLGASYRGLKPCGPRPWADEGPEVWVRFFPGAWGQIEWQCPELSKRFMWLAYGIKPYSAHGSQVVWNCDPVTNGCWLEKVTNGTPGRAPVPGDVLSYGSTSTYGHTAVVAASSVNAGGDGTIRVVEQNSAADGDSVLTVVDWVVLGSTSGWLHDSGNYSVTIAPQQVMIEGPSDAMIYSSQAFTATVSPIGTKRPVTYVWQVTGWPAIVHTGGLSDVLVLTWTSAGEQTVTVTAENGVGGVTAGHGVLVQAPLQAGFSASPLAGQAPLVVAFTDTSSGFAESWLWEFGDGATSSAQHPLHTYAHAGTFPVTLTVSGPGGTDSLVRSAYVRASAGPVAANFEAVPLVGPVPLAVQFVDTSGGEVTSWEWDLGDGTTSSVPSPSHTYAVSGVYTVRLTVSGAGGTDTETKVGYVVAAHWNRTHVPLVLTDYLPQGMSAPCIDLILNGGVEDEGGWELPGTAYTATLTSAPVHSGARAVRVGIVDPADNVASYSSARQLVTIPADASEATLRAWFFLVSGSSPGALVGSPYPATSLGLALAPTVTDAQYLLVLGENGQILETILWQRTDDRRWVLHEFDLLAYAGQTIKLHFGASNDGADAVTGMVIDDVSLEVCRPIGNPP